MLLFKILIYELNLFTSISSLDKLHCMCTMYIYLCCIPRMTINTCQAPKARKKNLALESEQHYFSCQCTKVYSPPPFPSMLQLAILPLPLFKLVASLSNKYSFIIIVIHFLFLSLSGYPGVATVSLCLQPWHI